MEYLILLVGMVAGVTITLDIAEVMRKINQISDKVDRLECGVEEGKDEQ